MSTPREDDLDTLPDAELLAMPGGSIPPGWLTEFFGRKAALIHQQDTDELALELSGGSTRHLMIFPGTDPKEKQRREEEDRRRAWLATQQLLEYTERSDRLLARIDEQERVIQKRRKEIEDNAIRLHDGRRVYVDGNQYRDENGSILQGPDRDEAAALRSGNPQASTWQQKTEIDDRYQELERLKQKVLQDRQDAERGGDISGANDKLSTDEKEFAAEVETRVEQGPTNYGSADYMAAYGDGLQPSTVPAFTMAAQGALQGEGATRTETETVSTDNKKTPQPAGQGAPKLG
jgi:hypothetical protein